MEMVYLGLFDQIFNQVLDRILMPVFNFVISILNVSLAFIFNDLLGSFLIPILEIAFDKYILACGFLFGTTSYEILVKPCFSILDTVERAFDVFIGLDNVIYYPNGTAGMAVTDKTLLETLFSFPTVQNAFWLIALSGIGIALLLSIYGVARSALDLDFENKKPVSHVMSQLFKAVVGTFLIPFMIFMVINLANVMLKTLDTTINVGNSQSEAMENSTLGSSLFVMCTSNAAWDGTKNRSKRVIQGTGHGIKLEVYDEINPDFDLMEDPRDKFLANDKLYNYRNSLMVWKYFNPGKFDYLGLYTGIFVMVILLICMISLIKRLLELLILYMVSPYFVAIMPLDDGEKFKQWFSMFLGKLFTGYGSLVALKVYLMLMPVFMRGGIELPNSSVTAGDILYYVFAIGGAWTVYKSSSLLTSLINVSAGRSEEQSMAAGAGALAAVSIRPVQNVSARIRGKMESKFVDEPLSKLKGETKRGVQNWMSKSGSGQVSQKSLQSGYNGETKKPGDKNTSYSSRRGVYSKLTMWRFKRKLKRADELRKKEAEKTDGTGETGTGGTGNKTDIPPISQGYGSGYDADRATGDTSGSASASEAGDGTGAEIGSVSGGGLRYKAKSRVSDPAADLKEKLADRRIKGSENNRGDKK